MSYRSFAAQQADKLAGISRTLHVSSRVIKYQRAEIPRTTVLDLLALSRKPRNHCRSGGRSSLSFEYFGCWTRQRQFLEGNVA